MTTQTITNGKLAAIVTELLTNPFSGEVDETKAFEQFCTDIAKVVADYCGGEVVRDAEYQFKTPSLDWATHYTLEVAPNDSSPEGGGIWAKPLSHTQSSVPVKYWDCYYSEMPTVHTHQFDISDQRRTNGQVFLDLGALDSRLDDMLAVTMEVNTNPLNGIDHVPCAHIHFDGDNLAVSLFKVGDKILVRPETDVTIGAFVAKFNANGPAEQMYWIE